MVVPTGQGAFRVGGLSPGDYEIRAEPSLRGVRSLGALIEHIRKVDYSGRRTGTASRWVTVGVGETVTVRFDVDAARAAPGRGR